MALPRLDLDFVARRRASPWVGRILLAAALTVCADMGLQYHDLSGTIVLGKQQLARSGRAAKPASAEEVAAARETVQRLSLPWTRLFAAIESAASDKVALTAIEPDPKNGTVKITGDAAVQLSARLSVRNNRPAVSQIVDGLDGSIPISGMNGPSSDRSMPLIRTAPDTGS